MESVFYGLINENIMTTREVLIEELGEQRVKELDDRALLALVEWAMLQYHEKQVKNCSIPDVSNRRELLIAYEIKMSSCSDEQAEIKVDSYLASTSN